MKSLRRALFILVVVFVGSLSAQQSSQKLAKKKEKASFSWVSPIGSDKIKRQKLPAENLKHGTFRSPGMGIDVGYHIYLPTGLRRGR